MVCSSTGAVRRVAVQPRRRARGLARNGAVPKLAHAVSAKGLAGAALPVRVAAVAPDSGALLVAVLVAALAGGGEDGVSCACAFVASSVCAVLCRVAAFERFSIAALEFSSKTSCVAIRRAAESGCSSCWLNEARHTVIRVSFDIPTVGVHIGIQHEERLDADPVLGCQRAAGVVVNVHAFRAARVPAVHRARSDVPARDNRTYHHRHDGGRGADRAGGGRTCAGRERRSGSGNGRSYKQRIFKLPRLPY